MSKSFIIKAIQYSLLEELSFDETREFWKGITFNFNDEELNEFDIQKIYTENNDIPMSLLLKVMGKAGNLNEKYVKIVQKHFGDFFTINSPFIIDLVPVAIDIILETFLKTKENPTEAFFDMYSNLFRKIIKFYDVRLIQKTNTHDYLDYIFLANIYRNDDEFSFFNHELFFKKFSENFPKIFSPNNEIKFKSSLEVNSYRFFLDPFIKTEIKNKKIINTKNKKVLGEFISIKDFFKDQNILNQVIKKILENDLGNYKVAKFHEDIYVYIGGNKEKIRILNKEKAYNSPVYLYNIRSKKEDINNYKLKELLRELMFYTSSEYASIIKNTINYQKDYMKYLSEKDCYHIEYKKGYIFENGKIITKSVQAKILWYLLNEYKKGRKSFYYQELIMNEDIFEKSKSHNLSKRLARLVDLINKSSDIIELKLSGDGICLFDVSKKYTLKKWEI